MLCMQSSVNLKSIRGVFFFFFVHNDSFQMKDILLHRRNDRFQNCNHADPRTRPIFIFRFSRQTQRRKLEQSIKLVRIKVSLGTTERAG